MSRGILMTFGIALSCVGLAGCERPVSYSADVKPILASSCLSCHANSGEGEAASGFAVNDYESLMKGTKFGKVIVPGSSMSSTLYLVVAQKTDPKIQMPPHHGDSLAQGRGVALPDDKVGIIAKWIDQGAKNN